MFQRLITLASLLLATSLSVAAQPLDKKLFTEENPNAFVILHPGKILAQYGIHGFCKDTSTYGCPGLSAKRYAGKKGYFMSMDPVKTDNGFEFRPVMLETGEKFFFVSGKELGTYGWGIENLSQTKRLRDMVGSAVAAGSSLTIKSIGKDEKFGGYAFTLSNGATVRAGQYEIAIKLMRYLPDDSRRSEFMKLLAGGARIEYDRIDDNFFIDWPSIGSDSSPMQAYIGIKSPQAPYLRMKAIVYDDNWIFANSYVVVAGNARHESSILDFKRDHTGGTIWEWRDEKATPAMHSLLKQVAVAPDAVVRFRGKGVKDVTMTAAHRRDLSAALRMFELMGGKI